MDKQAFMAACREGGAAIARALTQLDQQFCVQLSRESRRAIRDEGRADDAVQETFIKVWERCITYRGDSELLAWIRTILKHTILDMHRARKPEDSIEDEEGQMTPEVTEKLAALSEESNPTPPDLLVQDQSKAIYQRCLAEFMKKRPEQAAVIRWIAEEQMTNDEIQELLGRTPGATREFIRQSRISARQYFKEWYLAVKNDHDQ